MRARSCAARGDGARAATARGAGAPPRRTPAPGPDGSADAAKDGGADAELNGKGETCVGFGAGPPCGGSFPAFGYVCFGGSPPGFSGCKQATASALGETYCCPDNRCVAQPDQDKECKSASAQRRYQCPPDGNGGTVAPPPGCTDAGSGSSVVERYYCCP